MSRLVFEEVAPEEEARRRAAEAPKPGEADRVRARQRRALAIWLFVMAALVALVAAVGAATRLAEAGLSITEWEPIKGILPPFSEAAWLAEFEKYKLIPQFTELNHQMTLAEFKGIYWWEWAHRLVGRLLGVAFFIPFVFFAVKKWIPQGYMGRLILFGALGAFQGVLGWWMVSSGLEGSDRVRVAPYRLMAHLGLAALLFMFMLWTALSLLRPAHELLAARRRRNKGLMAFAGATLTLLSIQVLAGALVAGLQAGWQYSDWPMMGGRFFPEEGAALAPFWRNFFEDPATTQFLHRMLAYCFIGMAIVFWMRARRAGHAEIRRRANWVLGLTAVQVLVGVTILTHGMPFWLSVGHQVFAFALMAAFIWAKHEVAYPREEKIARA